MSRAGSSIETEQIGGCWGQVVGSGEQLLNRFGFSRGGTEMFGN